MRRPLASLPVAAAGLLLLFAGLAAWASWAPAGPWAERLAEIAPRRADAPLDRAALALSEATAPLGTGIAAGAAAVALGLLRRWRDVGHLAAALGGAGAAVGLAKLWWGGPRPLEDPLGPAVGAAFPSAHAASWAALVAALALLPPPRPPRAAVAVGAGAVLAIGASRVYLGAHDPRDVLAGFALGAGWACAVAAVLRATGR